MSTLPPLPDGQSAPPPQEPRRIHGCLVAFLIVLAVVVIGVGICLVVISTGG
jgi:hypothetical protein